MTKFFISPGKACIRLNMIAGMILPYATFEKSVSLGTFFCKFTASPFFTILRTSWGIDSINFMTAVISMFTGNVFQINFWVPCERYWFALQITMNNLHIIDRARFVVEAAWGQASVFTVEKCSNLWWNYSSFIQIDVCLDFQSLC